MHSLECQAAQNLSFARVVNLELYISEMYVVVFVQTEEDFL